MRTKKIPAKLFEIDLPQFYAHYLINGDTSTMTGAELLDAMFYERKFGNCINVSDEGDNFKRYKGSLHNVATFTFRMD